ncbi:hypothetical protein B296_00032375 [Ensete ventricosum]|uniref:Uncharacterized protein n=1 Tax=Ensete ventricosum TaxID=4639 RepID=A0A426ZLN8_ENSVE|nr:hypothetical protein B296_00032375 [Ensete ventricosum]
MTVLYRGFSSLTPLTLKCSPRVFMPRCMAQKHVLFNSTQPRCRSNDFIWRCKARECIDSTKVGTWLNRHSESVFFSAYALYYFWKKALGSIAFEQETGLTIIPD